MTVRDDDHLDDFFARPGRRGATVASSGTAPTATGTTLPAVRSRGSRTPRGRAPRPRKPEPGTTRAQPSHVRLRGSRADTRSARGAQPGTVGRPVGRSEARPRPAEGNQVQRGDRRRLLSFVVVVVCLGVAITARLVDVQLGGGASCRTLSVSDCRTYGAAQRQAFRPIPAGRGGIFDRNGQPFAMSVPEPNVVADPGSVAGPIRTARALAPVLGVSEATLAAKLAKSSTRYQLLALTVSAAVEKKVRALKLPGITLEERYVRRNPSDGLARYIVGRTYAEGQVDGTGRRGQNGLELAYDSQLEGTPGRLTFEKDPAGGTIAGTSEKLEAAKPGTDLYLTLDQSLQYAAEQAVAEQVSTTGAKQGMAVISRPSTGEILAMVSVADDGTGKVTGTGDNKPVSSVFEPGSVNKMITIAGAMDEGLVSADTTMNVPDNLLVADHRFTDNERHPTEPWTTTDILVTSSNIGTIKIAQQLGKEKIDSYLRKFGFGKASSTDFPGEVRGLMLPLDNWSGTSIGAIPIGQGISVTALQMLAAYNVIANDGVYVAPKLVAATDSGSGRVATDLAGRRRVVSAQTAVAMNAMLRKVVSVGTGTAAQVPGYPAAGKTGTARIPQDGPHANPRDAYQDAQGRYHYESSFVGFIAGADLSIIVTIQDAQTSIFGSQVAAPVFSHLASLALRNERIPPPALTQAAANAVPELSASARRLRGEDPGLVSQTTQG